MKSFTTSLLLLMSFSAILAQPTIHSSVVFDLGASAPIQFVDDYFQPGESGMDAHWDVGSINPTGDSWTWNALDPASTAFADSFPSANLAFPFPQGDTAENLVYYRFAGDSLSLLGAASTNIGGSGETFYTILEQDPDLIATFPFTYQSTHNDTYQGVNWISFSGMEMQQFRKATTQRTVDGYGTLITPLGTFPNAVRVKTTESIQDSLFFVVPIISTQEITRYTWYAEGEDYVLFHMDSIALTNLGITNVTFSAFYRSGAVTTSIDELDLADQWNLQVYPNPAKSHLWISVTIPNMPQASVSLHNMIGQRVLEKKIGSLRSPHQLNLSGTSPGTYLLRIQTEAGIAAKRIQINP